MRTFEQDDTVLLMKLRRGCVRIQGCHPEITSLGQPDKNNTHTLENTKWGLEWHVP